MGPRARRRTRGGDAVDASRASTGRDADAFVDEDDAENEDDDDDDDARPRPVATKPTPPARADAPRAPDDADLALAYDLLDPKSRGHFTARDVRRVADAHGFADWSDDAIKAMSAAFKPDVERRAVDPGAHATTRDEFVDIVTRSGARAR